MKATLKLIQRHLPVLLDNGIVPFIHGSPALGKSAIGKQLADAHNLKFIDLRLTELDPTDLHGLPNFKEGKATFVPFDTFPLEGDKIPEGYKGWCIFLDEINSANHSVQAACYKLVLDRMVGQHKLHPKVKLMAAGKFLMDKA